MFVLKKIIQGTIKDYETTGRLFLLFSSWRFMMGPTLNHDFNLNRLMRFRSQTYDGKWFVVRECERVISCWHFCHALSGLIKWYLQSISHSMACSFIILCGSLPRSESLAIAYVKAFLVHIIPYSLSFSLFSVGKAWGIGNMSLLPGLFNALWNHVQNNRGFFLSLQFKVKSLKSPITPYKVSKYTAHTLKMLLVKSQKLKAAPGPINWRHYC